MFSRLTSLLKMNVSWDPVLSLLEIHILQAASRRSIFEITARDSFGDLLCIWLQTFCFFKTRLDGRKDGGREQSEVGREVTVTSRSWCPFRLFLPMHPQESVLTIPPLTLRSETFQSSLLSFPWLRRRKIRRGYLIKKKQMKEGLQRIRPEGHLQEL